jgi:hypothetical protein
MTDTTNLTKVLVRSPYGPWEAVWAVRLGNDQFRIQNSLFLAYGVSYLDIVEALDAPGKQYPIVSRVIQKSGHRTIRAHVASGLDSPKGKDLRTDLGALGCGYEGSQNVVLSINVPPDKTLDDVQGCLVRHGVEWEMVDPSEQGSRQ